MVTSHQKTKHAWTKLGTFIPGPSPPGRVEGLRIQLMIDHGWVQNFPKNPSTMSLESFLVGEHSHMLGG